MTLLESRKRQRKIQTIKVFVVLILVLAITLILWTMILIVPYEYSQRQITELFGLFISFALLIFGSGIWVMSLYKPMSLDETLSYMEEATERSLYEMLKGKYGDKK